MTDADVGASTATPTSAGPPRDGAGAARGAAVERFLDRRAAVFVYGRRLHVVSLLVFRSDGLAWPSGDAGQGAATPVVRGFNLLVWRRGDLGYALVSDLNVGELMMLQARLAPPEPRQ